MKFEKLKHRYLVVWSDGVKAPKEVRLDGDRARKVKWRGLRSKRFIIQRVKYRRVKWEY